MSMKTWEAPETCLPTSRDAQPYGATSMCCSLSPAVPTGLSLWYKDAGFKPCQHSQPHHFILTSARLFALGETASQHSGIPKTGMGSGTP